MEALKPPGWMNTRIVHLIRKCRSSSFWRRDLLPLRAVQNVSGHAVGKTEAFMAGVFSRQPSSGRTVRRFLVLWDDASTPCYGPLHTHVEDTCPGKL